MEFYEYRPIDLEGRSMRLVQLCGAEFGPIRCRLFDAFLDDDSLMDYEALSYTWGDISRSQQIEMDGRAMPVTENLLQALKALRYDLMDRILWIDAICIDQDNLKERGHQVLQMGLIYKKAERVIVWLGPPTTETNDIFEDLQQFENQLIKSVISDWTVTDPRWQQLWDSVERPLRTGRIDPIQQRRKEVTHLLGRTWFQRVWIIQEIIHARTVQVLCGKSSVSGRTFALAPMLFEVTPSPQCQAILEVFPGPTRKYSWWAQDQDLRTLLIKFRSSKASDPRDRVYALLGIASDRDSFPTLQPDYNCREAQIAQRVVGVILGLPDGVFGQNSSGLYMKEVLRHLDNIRDLSLRRAAEAGQHFIVRKLLLHCDFGLCVDRKMAGTPIVFAESTGLSALHDWGVLKDNTSKEKTEWIREWILVLTYDLENDENLHYLKDVADVASLKPVATSENREAFADLAVISKRNQVHGVATMQSKEHELTYLLENRSMIRKPGPKDQTHSFSLFWWAAVHRRLLILSTLLEDVTYENAAYVHGQNLLRRLARENRGDVFYMLLRHWKPQIKEFRYTLIDKLSWISERNQHIIEKLATEGYWNFQLKKDSLEEWAEIFETEEVLRLLARKESTINDFIDNWHTPLTRAACTNNLDMPRLLLESDYTAINQRNAEFKTPLEVAVEYNNPQTLEILRHAPGIRISEEQRRTDNSSSIPWDRHNTIVSMLLDGETKSSSELRTIAQTIGDDEMRQLVYQRVVWDFSSLTLLSQSWLSYAARRGYVDIVRTLLHTRQPYDNAGYNLDVQQALSEATTYGHRDVVKILTAARRVDTQQVDPNSEINAFNSGSMNLGS